MGAIVGVVVVLAAALTAGAAGERVAACPTPKLLPASLKRPPAGASATQLANFVLALPQRKPCDVTLFTSRFDARTPPVPAFYPDGSVMKPAASPVPTEASVRIQLIEHFDGSTLKPSALALFDRPDLKAKLPDPTLRAALASLRGTIAEPVIGNFLSRSYSVAPRFCNCLPNKLGIAAATDSGRVIFFNARYQYEHFAAFSGILAHEILHQFPTSATPAEEVLLNTMTALVAMQILNRQPELARMGTELTRYMNDWRPCHQLAGTRLLAKRGRRAQRQGHRAGQCVEPAGSLAARGVLPLSRPCCRPRRHPTRTTRAGDRPSQGARPGCCPAEPTHLRVEDLPGTLAAERHVDDAGRSPANQRPARARLGRGNPQVHRAHATEGDRGLQAGADPGRHEVATP